MKRWMDGQNDGKNGPDGSYMIYGSYGTNKSPETKRLVHNGSSLFTKKLINRLNTDQPLLIYQLRPQLSLKYWKKCRYGKIFLDTDFLHQDFSAIAVNTENVILISSSLFIIFY